MSIGASGRATLIIATVLLVGLADPSRAASDGDTDAASPATEAPAGAPVKLSDYTKHASHHGKRHAHQKAARKSPADRQGADGSGDADRSVHPVAIPTAVANANAQIAVPDTPADNDARAMTMRAGTIVQNTPDAPVDAQPATDAEIVAPDQLNEIDRSLRDSAPPMGTLAMASAEPPAPTLAAATRAESSAWDQTSLVGKIFIGFGALLTLASAARMFMA
jgi:hypothetical protein